MRKLHVLVCSFVVMALTFAVTASASSVADFYKGQTVTLYNSGKAGSTSDTWARIIAKYLEEETGATVIVRNEAAGNGKMLFNQLAKTIKNDGLNICYTQAGTMNPPYVVGDKAVQYDINKFTYLGGIENANIIMQVSFDGPIKTVEDLMNYKKLRFAHSAKTSLPALTNAMTIELLNLDAKMIVGFDGTPGKTLAVRQGEAQATFAGGDSAIVKDKKGTLKALMQIGMERISPADDIPALGEFVDINNLTDTQKQLFESMVIIDDSKLLFAPEGIDQDKADFLAAAFDRAYANPECQQELTKYLSFAPGKHLSAASIKSRINAIENHKGAAGLWMETLDKYTK